MKKLTTKQVEKMLKDAEAAERAASICQHPGTRAFHEKMARIFRETAARGTA